jgi:tetratricopeptide (TPR) repeat protein
MLRFIFAGYLMCFLSQSSYALDPSQEPLRSLIVEGVELTINCRFEEAIVHFQQLIDKHPYHPIGHFYQGAVYHSKILDREDYQFTDQFYQNMDKAIYLTDSLHNIGQIDSWILFYQGSAFLYRSFQKAKTGSWFSSYKDARRGVNRLEKALIADSLLYDAYLGIGSFKYWKSARANFLLWLPFISDEREKGVKMVAEAVKKGQFVNSVGKDQLCWILMDKGDYSEAFKMAKENTELYPDSRFYKWTLASAAFLAGEFYFSYELYKELLSVVIVLPENNHFNEIDCLVKMADIKGKLKEWQESYDLADQALQIKLEAKVRKRAKNKLKKALKIRDTAKEKLNLSVK